MELMLFVLALILLALTALHRGADSRDGIDSPQWQRRQQWDGFH
jgi:hypothetical protein